MAGDEGGVGDDVPIVPSWITEDRKKRERKEKADVKKRGARYKQSARAVNK